MKAYVHPEREDHWGWTYNPVWLYYGHFQEMPFFIIDNNDGKNDLIELPKSWLAL